MAPPHAHPGRNRRPRRRCRYCHFRQQNLQQQQQLQGQRRARARRRTRELERRQRLGGQAQLPALRPPPTRRPGARSGLRPRRRAPRGSRGGRQGGEGAAGSLRPRGRKRKRRRREALLRVRRRRRGRRRRRPQPPRRHHFRRIFLQHASRPSAAARPESRRVRYRLRPPLPARRGSGGAELKFLKRRLFFQFFYLGAKGRGSRPAHRPLSRRREESEG